MPTYAIKYLYPNHSNPSYFCQYECPRWTPDLKDALKFDHLDDAVKGYQYLRKKIFLSKNDEAYTSVICIKPVKIIVEGAGARCQLPKMRNNLYE